jgi:Glycosyltransferase family 87
VRALALGLTAFLTAANVWTWILTGSFFIGGYADFRAFYATAYMVRTGRAADIYDYEAQRRYQDQLVTPKPSALPFIHPAFEALLYVPLSVLPYRAAYIAFLVLNLGVVVLTFWMMRPHLAALAAVYWWLPIALFSSFLPLGAALIQGQDSILLLGVFAATAVAVMANRPFAAGLFLGCGIFKFQLILPAALLFLLWRRWRFTAGVLCSSSLAVAVSVFLVGIGPSLMYGELLLSISSRLQNAAEQFKYAIPPEMMPNLRGLLFGLHIHSPIWGLVLSAVVLGVCTILGRKQSMLDQLLVAILASSLVSYHFLIHDMSILLIPIGITLNRHLPAEGSGDKKGRLLARTAALMFVAPLCFSYAPDHFYLVALPVLALLFALLAFGLRNGELSSAVTGEP